MIDAKLIEQWRNEVYQTIDEKFQYVADKAAVHGAEQAKAAMLADVKLEAVAYEHHEFRPMGAPGEIRIHGIFASQYAMPDGSTAGDFQWLADQYKAAPTTRRLDALVTLESAQQAVAAERARHMQDWSGFHHVMKKYGLPIGKD